MDLELTDEQRWLSESVDTLLEREWLPRRGRGGGDASSAGGRVWEELVAFGALSIGGEDGIGAVEACLIARSLGSHLAAVPFIASAAIRLALARSEPADSFAADAAIAAGAARARVELVDRRARNHHRGARATASRSPARRLRSSRRT